MAEQPEVSDNDDGAGDLRGKLVGRLAVAGLLVALLLGVLAFFDHLANPPEEPDEPVFAERVPVAPKKEMSQPVKPAENLPEPPAPEKAAPPVEPPPPPQVEAKPQAAVAPEAAPEKRPAGVIAKPAPAALPPPAVPEATSAPSNIVPPAPRAAAPTEPVAARPPAHVADHKPAPVASPSGVARLFSGFLLQAGVFTSVQRAEELHARLTLSGVPSTLETRVQVGPFRTRQEAEAAQAKLRELGVDTILVPPKGKN